MNDTGRKLKMLYLKEFFEQRTDENHSVTIKEIQKYLDSKDIPADRRTLYQDIEAQFGPQLKHPRYEVPRDQVHAVKLAEGSLIQKITGLSEIKVNSRHHQAVKELGKGLRPSAYAPDGLIEGVELEGKKFVLSVQWHPESLSDYAPDAQMLFNAFVKTCEE